MLMILMPCCKKDGTSSLPTKGLIACYPFNGNANDESGNGHDGMINGAVLTDDRFDVANKAFTFENTANITSTPPLPIGIASRTISAWFNTTSTSGSNGWYNNSIFSYGPPTQNNMFAAEVYQGELIFDANGEGSSGFAIMTGRIVNDGSWHHVVLTYDGTKVTIYLDNEDVGYINLQLATHSSSFCIGRRYAQENQYMDGEVDDVRIYDRVLTNEEIQSLYNEGGW